MSRFQGHRLSDAQAAAIDYRQDDAEAILPHAANQSLDFLAGQDHRQGQRGRRAHEIEEPPLALAHELVKETQRRADRAHRRRRIFPMLLEMEQILTGLRLVELHRVAAEVQRELLHVYEISL